MSSGPTTPGIPPKPDPAPPTEMEAQRGRIDRLDAEILALLNARIAAAVRIGAIKRELGLNVLDSGTRT